MAQMGRNAIDETSGSLRQQRYLLHDRDTKFCKEFRETLAAGGVKCLRLPARSPNLNAFAERWVRSVRELDVLLIDEFGYLNLKPEQSNIFFKLMEERYRRRPTIITTNLVYDEWPNFLGNRPMVEALLSRLRHYCHTVVIDGPPLREPQG
jgi:transposase InsO family protein